MALRAPDTDDVYYVDRRKHNRRGRRMIAALAILLISAGTISAQNKSANNATGNPLRNWPTETETQIAPPTAQPQQQTTSKTYSADVIPANVQNAIFPESQTHSPANAYGSRGITADDPQLSAVELVANTDNAPQPHVNQPTYRRLPQPHLNPHPDDQPGTSTDNAASIASYLEPVNRSESATKNIERGLVASSEHPETIKDWSEGASQSQADLHRLLERIATCTGLVLALGVGFILIARKFVGVKTKTQKPVADDSIKIISQLRLNAKSNLQLIEVGNQRVLVASDVNGIRSVVSLNNSFATTFDSLEAAIEAETDSNSIASSTNEPETVISQPDHNKPATAEIEIEMQRRLSEILGDKTFQEVFSDSTRAIA